MFVHRYHEEKKTLQRQKIKQFTSHPYFAFVILAAVLITIQMLSLGGILPTSFSRAVGNTIIYAMIGLGFALLLGYAGLASLGTAGFVGLGTYVTGYFLQTLGVPYLLALVVALFFAITLGIIVGFISLRIEGMYLAIITLGLSEILVELFKNLSSITNGEAGYTLRFGLPSLFTFFGLSNGIMLRREAVFVVLVIFLIALMILTINIINSPTGRAMLAMKNSDSAAQSMGISLLKYRLLAFVLATSYAVVGGFLYISYVGYSRPGLWSLALSLNILAAVIVGGAKNIWGILAGTLVIFGVDSLVFQNVDFLRANPGIALAFNGVLIIVIVMFYPGGLTRLFYDIKAFIHKLIQKRKEYKYGKDIS